MRYALYFTPPADAPLTRAATAWLGRDAFGVQRHVQAQAPDACSLDPDLWKSITADPRRYGFHATIKAPFRLARGCDETQLMAAVESFARRWQAFDIDLALAAVGPFFALVEATPSAPLARFAEAVVRDLEPFRAALTESEIARRRPERLSPRERALLEQFGYPHVLDEFEFHMSLTGPVSAENAASVHAELDRRFGRFTGERLCFSHLALFQEDAEGADFHVRAIHALGQPKDT